MAVEEEAVTAVWVDGATSVFVWDGGDCLREIGVNGEFDVGGAVRNAGLGVVGVAQIRDSLLLGFAPKIVQRHDFLYAIKPPKPVAGDWGIGFGGDWLGALGGISISVKQPPLAPIWVIKAL